jgi:hypothetical protein
MTFKGERNLAYRNKWMESRGKKKPHLQNKFPRSIKKCKWMKVTMTICSLGSENSHFIRAVSRSLDTDWQQKMP